MPRPCPCGTGLALGACCGPLLDGAPADTPEALMRSRYTAFAFGDEQHLLRTWHPTTRPAAVPLDPSTRWTGLEVLRAEGTVVAFVARYEDATGSHELRETSRFARADDTGWQYVRGRHE
ncbi:MAG: YchJ family metal-binding protein [Aeromicrobium erythreum]